MAFCAEPHAHFYLFVSEMRAKCARIAETFCKKAYSKVLNWQLRVDKARAAAVLRANLHKK
jgi:hypothetical protein